MGQFLGGARARPAPQGARRAGAAGSSSKWRGAARRANGSGRAAARRAPAPLAPRRNGAGGGAGGPSTPAPPPGFKSAPALRALTCPLPTQQQQAGHGRALAGPAERPGAWGPPFLSELGGCSTRDGPGASGVPLFCVS
ncbi:hypothetical protein Rsub_00060 [Raphidocelis subcapitata]|uniref:Uncharacterized protein n=1 Tax=Raphidocelis subcapitata TaxID=307507 RepID=A0A2V0NK50_9CHLO|nr:hypothetical protein Rsub_00060 [Raphidocelis subcapitata]|eukprot:GBF87349.1 hypothetical protein Rsub_00060 [Raphidocelis subcapitata]